MSLKNTAFNLGLAVATSLFAMGASAQTMSTSATANSGTTQTSDDRTESGTASARASSATNWSNLHLNATVTSSAAGTAGAGRVGTYAQTTANTFTSWVSQFGVSGHGYTYARAEMSDSFVIAAGSCLTCTLGSTGTMTFAVRTDGSMGGNGLFSTTGSYGLANWSVGGNWNASGGLSTVSGGSGANVATFSASGSMYRFSDGRTSENGSFGQIFRTVSFVFGGTNELRLFSDATADAQAAVWAFGSGSSASSDASMTTDFSHTLAWDGITEVKDSAGNVITGFTALSSASKFDYAKAYVSTVPEPETYAMLLAGLGLIGNIARRRRSAARA